MLAGNVNGRKVIRRISKYYKPYSRVLVRFDIRCPKALHSP
jgi:hypothetical protein